MAGCCAVRWCVALTVGESPRCAVHQLVRRKDLRPALPDTADVPDPDVCNDCGGMGECLDCDGTGEHGCEHANCRDVHECPTCDGAGDCHECDGKGVLQADKDTDELTASEREYLRFAFNLDAPVWQSARPLIQWPWDEAGA